MVEVGGKSPYSQAFDNSVFIIPAILIIAVVAFVGSRLLKSIKEKEERAAGRKNKKEGKKTK